MAVEVEAWPDAAAIDTGLTTALFGTDNTVSTVPSYSVDDVDGMLTEFEHLFVGPGPVPCPPYESYWRTDVPPYLRHSLMGPCIPDLLRLYRLLGVDLDPDAGEMPDHAAVEFEAVAFALSIANGGVEDDVDEDESTGLVNAAIDVTNELLINHMAVWLPNLCKAVADEAKHPFYQGLASVTMDWFMQLHRIVTA